MGGPSDRSGRVSLPGPPRRRSRLEGAARLGFYSPQCLHGAIIRASDCQARKQERLMSLRCRACWDGGRLEMPVDRDLVAAGRRIFSAARVSDFDAEGQPTLKGPTAHLPARFFLHSRSKPPFNLVSLLFFPSRLRKSPRCGSCWAVRSWPLSPCKSLSPGSARGRTWVRTATGRWQPGRTIPRTKRKRTENEKRSSSPDASNRAESEYCATSRSPATAFGSLAMPGLPSSGGDDRHLHHARQACGTQAPGIAQDGNTHLA